MSLGFFLPRRLGGEYRLQRVGVIASVPHFGCNGHWGRGEVLHLLQMETQFAGDISQLGHVLLMAAGVGGNEVGYDLLIEMLLTVNAVEDAFELVELLEGRFTHEHEYTVAGMLRSHLQSSADVAGDEFAGVFLCGSVGGLVLTLVQQKVVAHAAANETFLDAWQGIDGVVDVEQLGVVGVEVGAYLGMYAAGAAAFLAGTEVASVHAIHVGTGATEVAEIAFEVGHLGDLLYLFQYALLRATGNELALMGRDGAEGAATETAAMDVDAVLNHVVGRNALALVLRVRLTRVRQVERGIKLFGGHRRVGWIDHDVLITRFLQQSLGMHHVRLFLNVTEVLGLCSLVVQTFLMRVQHNVVLRRCQVLGNIYNLWQFHKFVSGETAVGVGDACQLNRCLLAHTVSDEVGSAVQKNAGTQTVLPVVVVGEPAQ